MTLKVICNTIIRGEKALAFPLSIHNGWISDANGHHILDIRGWGYLQYHSDGHTAAAKLQDAIGDWVVRALNREAAKEMASYKNPS